MEVKIGDKKVEVLDHLCKTRSCFVLGVDKGTFVPGRGYTSYYAKQKWCCQRRMLHGCPTASQCVFCHRGLTEDARCECPRSREVNVYVRMVEKAVSKKAKAAAGAAAAQGFRDAYQALAQAQADDAAARAAQS